MGIDMKKSARSMQPSRAEVRVEVHSGVHRTVIRSFDLFPQQTVIRLRSFGFTTILARIRAF